MKRTIAIVAILAAISLPVMAQDAVVLTPTKLYDLIEQLQKRAHGAAERDQSHEKRIKQLDEQVSAELDTLSKAVGDLQKRNAALEKKVTHITRILKLKQEQGK